MKDKKEAKISTSVDLAKELINIFSELQVYGVATNIFTAKQVERLVSMKDEDVEKLRQEIRKTHRITELGKAFLIVSVEKAIRDAKQSMEIQKVLANARR